MRLSPRERWIGFVTTAVASLYVWFTLQPDLLLSNTTANGGDTGAHVWWPAFLRDHILPKWRLTGWAPDWYAGFPAGVFYFPLPSLLVVVLDIFLPYNVAFKLVTALGPVMLPIAAYSFARGIGARWPGPPLFAVAARLGQLCITLYMGRSHRTFSTQPQPPWRIGLSTALPGPTKLATSPIFPAGSTMSVMSPFSSTSSASCLTPDGSLRES